MTPIEFGPYSDYHIWFKLTDGRELSGVVLLPSEQKKAYTLYDFIPTANMIEWKLAEKKENKEMMNRLRGEIDITNIVWADLLKY